MKTTILPMFAAFVMAACVTVQAQQSNGCGYGNYVHAPRNYYPCHRAATAGEAHLRGMAAAVQARGEYNLLTAQALVAAEQARQLRIHNHELAVNTRLSIRETNRQAQAKARGPRMTQEQAIRQAAAARPQRLSPKELNPQTGRVSWPTVLRAEQFATSRRQMESLLAGRASREQINDGGRGAEVVKTLRALLKSQVREVRPTDYMAARRFLDRLATEVRQPGGNRASALAMVQPAR